MGNTSPLRRAMLKDDLEQVKDILNEAGEGAPDIINEDYTSDCLLSRDRNVQSPLHTAISKDQDNIAEVLFQYGADVDNPGLWGQTGLHLAAKRNNVELCKLAIKYGANVYAEDNNGKKPIHSAAMSFVSRSSGRLHSLKYILEEVGKPEDVHLTDVDGRTPLHDAARWGNVRSAEYLISKGADVNAKSEKGLTPSEEVGEVNRKEMLALFSSVTKQKEGNSI